MKTHICTTVTPISPWDPEAREAWAADTLAVLELLSERPPTIQALAMAAGELIDEEQHLAERRQVPCPIDPDRPCPCLNSGVPANGCEPIHNFFSLSYASYLVLRRSILQSMPVDWQARLVALLNELDDATEDLEDPVAGFKVRTYDEDGNKIDDPFEAYDRGRRRVELKRG